jgi:dipeptidyl aminopeptidase/acylaminoacyl peptidase
MPLAPGTLVGPYEILAPLGAGGMGEVYRARDSRLSRDVAVKVLPSDLAQDKDRLKRFEHEARAAGALNHPNLLTIFDVGSQDGVPYLVSELLEGETLRQALARGPLPPRKAVDQAGQIARGLGAAHEKGIVHRDLKPENLFLDRDGRAKILDFGLAKLKQPLEPLLSNAPTVTSPTSPGSVLGTVGYMAPEQVRGEDADARADIFSFGAVLFEMLSGRRAFSGATAVETMNAILNEDPGETSASGRPVPPALERIVRRCLEKSPRARFQSAQDLAFALEALSGDSSGSIRSGVGVAPTSRRRRSAWAAVMTASALGVAGAGFLLGRRSAQRPAPVFERLTFRYGNVGEARFGPDGQTVYYSAEWGAKPSQVFSARSGSLESRPLDLPDAGLLALSSSGEMALALHPVWVAPLDTTEGTLARVPLAGGSPREVLEGVRGADWSPDGAELAVVKAGEKDRLEFPIGSAVLEAGKLTHPRVSPHGDSVAVFDRTNWPACSVVLVDRKGSKRTLTAANYHACSGLAWSRDGREIWFTASDPTGSASLRAVSLTGQLERVVHANPGALTLRDISRRGEVLLARRTWRFSIRGRVPGEDQEQDLSWLNDSYAMDLSPDGTTLLLGEFVGAAGLRPLFMRRTDGSAAVRLGDGRNGRLSPDGKWVAATSPDASQVVLLPTGAGQARSLPRTVSELHTVEWFSDSRRILARGRAKDTESRFVTWTQDVDGGPPVPILEGYSGILPSPDGRSVLATTGDEGPFALCPVVGGPCQLVQGLDPAQDEPLLWSNDGKTLLVARYAPLQVTLMRVDPTNGRSETLKSIAPPERAGIFGFAGRTRITPDGRYYVYSYGRCLGDLYLARGLR